jgi:hypothetical protein
LRKIDNALAQVLGTDDGSAPETVAPLAALKPSAPESVQSPGWSRRFVVYGVGIAVAILTVAGVVALVARLAPPNLSPAAVARPDASSPHSSPRVTASQSADASGLASDSSPDRVLSEHRPVHRAQGPSSRPGGRLWVNLLPWARVTVDGELVGDTPQKVSLPPGRHRVVLENPKLHLRRQITVTITAGETLRIERW